MGEMMEMEQKAKNAVQAAEVNRDRFSAGMDCAYAWHGVIDQSIRYIEEFQLLRPELWRRFVQQFREDADFDAGWRGEYWGKMMRGACFTYSYTQNGQLYDILTQTVSDMMESADPDGRISSYGRDHEFDGWDIWSRKYVLLGMQYFHEICKDAAFAERIVASMCAQTDYIIGKIGDGPDKMPITAATRHWRGLNSSSLLEPVVRLYRLTGKQKYLDFAEYIVDCGGTDVENIFDLAYADELAPYQYPVTKAYEMTSCFEGLLEYYRITGIERYKTAVMNFAEQILKTDFTVIGSCGCTHELFDHSSVRQANTTNTPIAQETCVTVTLMKFFYQLLLLTGDPVYADAFERSAYNAFLGAINTEKVVEPLIAAEHPTWNAEPLPFDSYSPLTAGTRGNGIGGLKLMSDNHYYGCCACIGSAGCGLIPKITLLRAEDGLVLNLFISGTVTARTPAGGRLVLKQETAYPRDGAVRITFDMDRDEEFTLWIRNPAWSKTTEVTVNGAPAAVSGGYIKIRRVWKSGDAVELALDMRTEAVRPVAYAPQVLMNKVIWGKNYMVPAYDRQDPLALRHIAFRRGPLMLAQDSRLGYSVDDPAGFLVGEDGYVEVQFPAEDTAPYAHIVETQIPMADGGYMTVTDYASAGKLWTEESKMAVWMLTEKPMAKPE